MVDRGSADKSAEAGLVSPLNPVQLLENAQGQFERCRHKVLAQVCKRRCTGDWQEIGRALQEPRERNALRPFFASHLGHFSRYSAVGPLAPVDVGRVVVLFGEFGHEEMMGR